ncbi:metallophosphoesterase [Planctomycetota bacterium]
MKRNQAILIIVIWIFLCQGVWGQSHTEDSPEPTAKIVAGPYLQAPAENTMTVMWLTDKKCTGWVEYGSDKDLGQRAISSHDGMVDAYITIHKVKITGLQPGAKYYYRVASEEILEFGPYYDKKFSLPFRSEVFSFKTNSTKKEKVSVLCFNDIHERVDMWRDLMQAAGEEPYEVVFLNGDIMDYLHGQEQVVNNLLNPATEMFAREVPFCYTRGNHEGRGNFARNLRDYVSTVSERYYYAFSQGPVRFIVIDTGEDKEDSHAVYANLNVFDAYRSEQAEWLNKEVQSEAFRQAKWRVLMTHQPLEAEAKGYGVKDSQEKFSPYLNGGKIDLNIAGHTHRARIVDPKQGQDYPIVIGGGSNPKGATVIRLDVTESTLTVTTRNIEGEVLNTFELKK